MDESDFLQLGEPDISIAGLNLWMRGREFPQANDYWDGNWLQTVAYCSYPGAKVWTEGPFLRIDEIERFVAECELLDRTLSGEAVLNCLEPYLKVHLSCNSRGQIRV